MNGQLVRIKVLSLFFLLFGVIITARLFFWQVVQAEQLSLNARSQQQRSLDIPARRGAILSKDNYPLATTFDNWLLWASVPKIKNPEDVSQKLALITVVEPPQDLDATKSAQVVENVIETDLEKEKKELIKKEEDRLLILLSKKDVVWVALKHKISNDLREKIKNLNIDGIGFDPEEGRLYPEGSMASHLLGFVGNDAAGSPQGYFGLEGFYNLTLQGSEGLKSWEKDAQGAPILLAGNKNITALNGLSLKTYIDRSIQFIVEKQLKDGIEKYKASSGTVIVLDPKRGSILAMASYPSFEPAFFNLYPSQRFTDPAISQSFEPGSIFKPLVMAAALDSGVVEPQTKCSECSGPRHIAEYTIETGTKKYYPDSTMTEIIQHSDNVGMVWVAEQLGQEKLYEYLTKFGIGQPTGVDLQGEETPQIRKKEKWGLIDLATASFGQGIAVTSIEMVRAIGTIANKGLIAKPRVVDKLMGDGWEQKVSVENKERVISEKSALEITAMMVNNVESRDDWDRPKGVKIAGKTGTAQIPIAGHYDPDKTIHSFVGFGPADNPKFAMLVTLKDPKAYEFAAQTAAPVWFAITKEIMPYMESAGY